MLAVGPPTSLTVPRNSGWPARRSISARSEADGARLDGLPLVVGDGAEGAAAEAAPVSGDRESDLLVGRDRLPVGRVRQFAKRQGIDAVEFGFAQGEGRRVDHQPALAVLLGERPAVVRAGLDGGEAEGAVVGSAVVGDRLEGGEHHRLCRASSGRARPCRGHRAGRRPAPPPPAAASLPAGRFPPCRTGAGRPCCRPAASGAPGRPSSRSGPAF